MGEGCKVRNPSQTLGFDGWSRPVVSVRPHSTSAIFNLSMASSLAVGRGENGAPPAAAVDAGPPWEAAGNIAATAGLATAGTFALRARAAAEFVADACCPPPWVAANNELRSIVCPLLPPVRAVFSRLSSWVAPTLCSVDWAVEALQLIGNMRSHNYLRCN